MHQSFESAAVSDLDLIHGIPCSIWKVRGRDAAQTELAENGEENRPRGVPVSDGTCGMSYLSTTTRPLASGHGCPQITLITAPIHPDPVYVSPREPPPAYSLGSGSTK